MQTDNPSRSRRPALGRGLSALIPTPPSSSTTTTTTKLPSEGGGLVQLAIESIRPSSEQPRQHFDGDTIAELAESIREHGVIQPIIVRHHHEQGFELIAGERRWRAAQKAGLREIPALVSERDDDDALLIALVENIQREDLNPIEEAEAYRKLSDELELSQEQIAQRVGKDRTTVANAMRLLKLPEQVRSQVASGELSMGHARSLLGLDEASAIERMAREIVRKKLSVRDVERRVKLFKKGPADRQLTGQAISPALRDVTEKLMRALACKVVVKEKGRGRGTIEISYSSLDEFDRIMQQICD